MCKTLIVCFFFLICLFTKSYANNLECTETELYEEAVKLYDQKKYRRAIRAFQKIEDLYPLSYWAMKAKLLSGISHYNMGKYSDAASDMNDYVYIYPNGEDLSYVYYLRVLSYYMQINKVQLGQQIAYKALELATEYINLFPNGEHIEEIKEKERLITEHISKKDYSIGEFYLKRGEYLAAIKRFQNIIGSKEYRYSPRVVSYLITAYLALGLELEAEHCARSMLRKE